MTPVYIDIETLPTDDPATIAKLIDRINPPGNMSKPETIAAWERNTKPDLVRETIDKSALGPVVPPHIALGKILCIGLAIGGDEPVVIRADDDEVAALKRLYEIVAGLSWSVFVGHNVREFDLRYLAQRSAILGLRGTFRVGDMPDHFDTMLEWTGHYTRHVSLDWLCHAFGIPGKGDITGADVPRLYREGRVDEIMAYCADDVRRVRAVYKRMTFQEPTK
jgi:3'-5' exonuclease